MNAQTGKDTLRQARLLIDKARKTAGKDAATARHLYDQAASRWLQVLDESREKDPFAASQYLTAARKAGWDLREHLDLAGELDEFFRENAWVQSALGWWMLAQSKRDLPAGRFSEALEHIGATCDLLGRAKNPESLARGLFYRLRDLLRAMDLRGRHRQTGMGLVEVLLANGDGLLDLLDNSTDSNNPKHFKPLSCQFLYLVRKLGLDSGRHDLLERFMGLACERYPRDEWFAEAHVQAARLRGDLNEAARRGREAFSRSPGSWAVARARAAVERERGNLDRAIKIMTWACLRSDSVWAFQELAHLQVAAGLSSAAADSLACGLGVCPDRDLPNAWRLFFERAGILAGLGRKHRAAIDSWLACRVRAKGGWGSSRELDELCDTLGPVFRSCAAELGGLHDYQAFRRYRLLCLGLTGEFKRRQMRKGIVTKYDMARGFGFVRLTDGRSVFLHKRVAGKLKLAGGEKVLILAVPGYDRKRDRQSWEAVEVELA